MASSLRPREERKTLHLSARMLAEQGWRDVTVGNVSSRGMMLRCESPPARNTFVEIRHRKASIVGRVIWSSGTAFGINSQDIIDLQDLLAQAPARSRTARDERRLRPRSKDLSSVQMRVLPTDDASRIVARLFDWCAIAIAVAIAAMVLADLAGDALNKPLEKTRSALSAQKLSR